MLRTWAKHIARRGPWRRVAAALLAAYLRGVRHTCGLKIHGDHHRQAYAHRPVIVAFWHNRMALAPMAWQSSQEFFMMISDHADGKMIAKVVEHFGIHTLDVSQDPKERWASWKRALGHLKRGHAVGITPDGPRGPCYGAQRGVFLTALVSGCDVLVLSYATSHRWRFKSWDRFFLPLPFGQGHLMWGEPLVAPTHKHQEQEFLRRLTDALNGVTAAVHALAGIPPDETP